MLLVMDSAKVFSNGEEYSPLWQSHGTKLIHFFLPLRMNYSKLKLNQEYQACHYC
ncbi:uncharacterized protein LOC142330043 isoform X2 [Lycorma delicatula]|uniref:uncharacterized protein LOC142330043 isoform X2 n=1 Tax=Lycorma delicatula TaxID=130591 RepID=UPI003F517B8E